MKSLISSTLILAAASGFAVTFPSKSVFAQESSTTLDSKANSTTMKVNDVLGNKQFAEDREITDSRIKAEGGSFSQYSLKVSLSYAGPPIGDLENPNQPNPDGSIGNSSTNLGGSISGRYRIDKKSAISVGTGLKVLTPFHKADRTDVKTPFVNYDRNDRAGNLQMRNSYGASLVTEREYQEVGQFGTLSYDASFVYNIGYSGFAVGVDLGPSLFLYSREYDLSDQKNASRYFIGMYPQIKYNITDKVNVYTSVAVSYKNLRSVENEFELRNSTLSGRLGMGAAITKSIYFAPFLNFYPNDMRADSTTISFATIFSIL